tara:strand:- start:279 stop:464 length:186 start_codon:yes stop_codon:yes gene_type:complete
MPKRSKYWVGTNPRTKPKKRTPIKKAPPAPPAPDDLILTKADYRGFSKGGVVTFTDISKMK